jgi:hypothetical protein
VFFDTARFCAAVSYKFGQAILRPALSSLGLSARATSRAPRTKSSQQEPQRNEGLPRGRHSGQTGAPHPTQGRGRRLSALATRTSHCGDARPRRTTSRQPNPLNKDSISRRAAEIESASPETGRGWRPTASITMARARSGACSFIASVVTVAMPSSTLSSTGPSPCASRACSTLSN